MPLALAQAGPAARVPAPIRPLAFPPIKRHNRQPIQPKQAGHETSHILKKDSTMFCFIVSINLTADLELLTTCFFKRKKKERIAKTSRTFCKNSPLAPTGNYAAFCCFLLLLVCSIGRPDSLAHCEVLPYALPVRVPSAPPACPPHPHGPTSGPVPPPGSQARLGPRRHPRGKLHHALGLASWAGRQRRLHIPSQSCRVGKERQAGDRATVTEVTGEAGSLC